MKTNKFSVNLFCSLMLLSLIPFLYTIVRTNLIANSPSTDGLGIAGHLEWFDLINETIQAFLIVPLYALLNRCVHHKDLLRQRIFQAFLIVNGIYIVFAIFIFMRCNAMVRSMASGRIQEVTGYLQLETIGFICNGAFENSMHSDWRFVSDSKVWCKWGCIFKYCGKCSVCIPMRNCSIPE